MKLSLINVNLYFIKGQLKSNHRLEMCRQFKEQQKIVNNILGT